MSWDTACGVSSAGAAVSVARTAGDQLRGPAFCRRGCAGCTGCRSPALSAAFQSMALRQSHLAHVCSTSSGCAGQAPPTTRKWLAPRRAGKGNMVPGERFDDRDTPTAAITKKSVAVSLYAPIGDRSVTARKTKRHRTASRDVLVLHPITKKPSRSLRRNGKRAGGSPPFLPLRLRRMRIQRISSMKP